MSYGQMTWLFPLQRTTVARRSFLGAGANDEHNSLPARYEAPHKRLAPEHSSNRSMM